MSNLTSLNMNPNNMATVRGNLIEAPLAKKVKGGTTYFVRVAVPGYLRDGQMMSDYPAFTAYVPDNFKPGALAWATKGAPVSIHFQVRTSRDGDKFFTNLEILNNGMGLIVEESRAAAEARAARKANAPAAPATAAPGASAPAVNPDAKAAVMEFFKAKEEPATDPFAANMPPATPADPFGLSALNHGGVAEESPWGEVAQHNDVPDGYWAQ